MQFTVLLPVLEAILHSCGRVACLHVALPGSQPSLSLSLHTNINPGHRTYTAARTVREPEDTDVVLHSAGPTDGHMRETLRAEVHPH